MSTNPLPELTTESVTEQLKAAVRYESAMESGVASGSGTALSPLPFMPAAKVAYQRMLAILEKRSLQSSDLDMIHAEYLGILEQPHYHGAQLWFVSMLLDEWLAVMSPGGLSRPRLLQAYRSWRLDHL